MFDGQAEKDRVESSFPTRDLMGSRLQVSRKAPSIVRTANLRTGDIEADDVRSVTRKASAHLPFTAADIQYPPSAACIPLD